MANSSPNLKVNIGADTSQFTKGVKDARREIKDFEKVSGDALSSVGNALGVNTGKLEQMANAIRGMGAKMKESSNTSVQALGSILSKLDAVSAGIAGLGIAAATISFKQLNAEANYFKSTIEGANIEMATSAYVSAYSAALHDMNMATGENVAKFESNIKEWWGRFKANIGQGIANIFTERGVARILAGIAVPGGGRVIGSPLSSQTAQAAEIAEQVKDLTIQLDAVQQQLNLKQGEWARIEARIAALRLDMVDPTLTLAERADALAEAQTLITNKAAEEKALRDELVRLQTDINGATTDTRENQQKLVQYTREAELVDEKRDASLKSLVRTSKAITAEAAKEAEERAKARAEIEAAAKAIADSRAALAATDLSVSGGLAGLLPAGVVGPDGALEIPVKLKAEEESWKEMESLVAGFVESAAASIGQLVGDLATGGNAWGNFKNTALSALADMAIAVGKLAISTGVATIGIKKALESMNGYVAIAAGVALVALGSAVKAGLSNIASGDYTAAAAVASSGYGSERSMAGGYTAREMTVNVTGTLKADGDQLITVINNTNRRNSYTQ